MQCDALQHGGNKDSLDSILGLASATNVMLQLRQLNSKVCAIQRLFLFRRVDIITLDVTSISDNMKNGNHHLRPVLLVGIFYDGLVAFNCARRATDKDSREEWYERGVYSSKTLLSFSDHSSWNWENKALLLSAENMYTNGDFVVLHPRMIRLFALPTSIGLYMKRPLQVSLLEIFTTNEISKRNLCPSLSTH